MTKIIGINDTSNSKFKLPEWIVGTLSGLVGSAEFQLGQDLSTLSKQVKSLFGGEGVDFRPSGLMTNTSSVLKYMISGRRDDASLGVLEIKGTSLPTYDIAQGRWTAMPTVLTMTSISYVNTSSMVNGEKLAIEGTMKLSHPKVDEVFIDSMDFWLSKISLGNSDFLVSLIGDRFRISAQTYQDGTAVSDPVVTGTIKGLQIDLAGEGGVYDHISLGFSFGRAEDNNFYLELKSISSYEDGINLPLLSFYDLGIKIQDAGDEPLITRGATSFRQGEDFWSFVFGGSDLLQGTSENDSLDGGVGNDTLVGLDGDDTFYVNGSNDNVTEKAGEGYDTIVSTAQSYVLPANVECLVLQKGDAVLPKQNAVGNAGKNTLIGNELDNTLYGRDGNDTLIGGAGKDLFVFDSRPKALTNFDVISDFNPGEDRIGLSWQYFRQSSGANKANFLAIFDEDEITADTRILYDEAKGFLYYDADGSKTKSKPVLFAKLIGAPDLDGTLEETYFSLLTL